MLVLISYKRKKDSKLYQTSGTMTVPLDDIALAVLHLDANEYEVKSVKAVEAVEEQ